MSEPLTWGPWIDRTGLTAQWGPWDGEESYFVSTRAGHVGILRAGTGWEVRCITPSGLAALFSYAPSVEEGKRLGEVWLASGFAPAQSEDDEEDRRAIAEQREGIADHYADRDGAEEGESE